MWIARADYQKLLGELVEERGRRHQLELQVAQTTQRDDWLMVRINSLENERAALFERFFQVAYAPPAIERSNEQSALRRDGPVGGPITDYPLEPSTPSPAARPRMPVMATAPPAHPSAAAAAKMARAEDATSALAALHANATAFDDMGDEDAAKMGVAWDEFGNVIHAPGA